MTTLWVAQTSEVGPPTVVEDGSLQVKCQQGSDLWEDPKIRMLPQVFIDLGVAAIAGCSLLPSHTTPVFAREFTCVSSSGFCIRTLDCDLELTPVQSHTS
jgi:hypothetical protein